MSDATLDADVVIVGAGMVGLALACALSESNLTIIVVDKHSPADEKPHAVVEGFEQSFDHRVSSLTLASQQLLINVDAWSSIKEKASPYTQMHVWDAEGTGSIHFSAQDIHETVLGHIVENSVTQTALWQSLTNKKQVRLLMGSGVNALSDEAECRRILTLENGQKIQARLIVAADGAHSLLRELAGFELRQWSYEHTAIVTTVKTQKSHQQTAWQRFTVDGPIAFLPLVTQTGDTHYCSIVWSLKTPLAEKILQFDDAEFCKKLTRAFESTLGDIVAVDKRTGFPLTQRHAKEYVKARVALVGDAAHTIHPLAGQGVNLGFLDAAVLAEEIILSDKRGADIGGIDALKKFERRRQSNNLIMMSVMEGFKRLFEQEALPVRWLRNVGLRVVDKLGLVKMGIMKRAMGLEGDLPEVMKR